jgi:hypothetical protein
MHHSTRELRAWVERPSYGPPSPLAAPTSVPEKCTMLEELRDDSTRQCQRSTKCTKPDGHPGFCVGAQPGPRSRASSSKAVCTAFPAAACYAGTCSQAPCSGLVVGGRLVALSHLITMCSARLLFCIFSRGGTVSIASRLLSALHELLLLGCRRA